MKLTPRVWARVAATVIAPFSSPALKIAIIVGSPFIYSTVALRSRSLRQVSARGERSL